MRWGLALSGGALRGAAHIGVLSVLDEHNLRPAAVAGTSSGSLVAALYALGFTPAHMERLLGELSCSRLYDLNLGWATLWNLLLNLFLYLLRAPASAYRSLPTGLLKGQKLARWLSDITYHHRFYDTHIPLAVMATEINSGEAVCYHTPGYVLAEHRFSRPVTIIAGNDLVGPLRASTAIPGVFRPVELDGRMLVDGGVVDNLPAEALRAVGVRNVVAVNLGYPGQQPKRLESAVSIAVQAVDIMAREITIYRGIRAADYVINPKIYDVGLTDFDRLGECVERGRAAALAALPDIKALVG